MQFYGEAVDRLQLERTVGQVAQAARVDLLSHCDGPERGNRVLHFVTGSGLEFDLMIDRAMDLARLTYNGVAIGWHSSPGFRSPWLHETGAEDGYGWFRSMSGLLNSCGLDHIHAPERDTAEEFHHPPRPTIGHTLHGRIAYTPAKLLGYGTRWVNGALVLYAEAEIRQATVFGEHLVLTRKVEVPAGTNTFRMHDEVRNAGFDTTPHAYLWHINIGWPLLAEGSELVAPVTRTPWQLRDQLDTEHGPFKQSGPQQKTTQQVFEHELELEADGTGRAALINPAFQHAGDQGLALEIAYDGHAMPAFFQWQNFQAGSYVMALEPATTHAGTRTDWRNRGEFKLLEHGDTASYRLELTPHLGAAALDDLRNRLAPGTNGERHGG